jgi:hypothetical protein
MNIFNRLAMLLLSLAALAFGVVVLLLLSGLISPTIVSPGGLFLNQWRFFAHLNGAEANTAVLVCAIVAVVGLILLILELLPSRRQSRDFVVRDDARGKVTIARTSVRDLVRYEAASMPEVKEAAAVADTGPKGFRVQVRAAISPDADAVKVAQALQDRVQQAIQHHTGLPTAQVHVMTQIEPFARNGRRRVR